MGQLRNEIVAIMKILPFLVFALVNFVGLYFGGRFTTEGVQSEWYAELDKAPWTPPGWVFGAAWTLVMVGYSWFQAGIWRGTEAGSRGLWIAAFALSWALNVLWNPVFFGWHGLGLGLVVLLLLQGTISWMAFQSHGVGSTGLWRWAMLPYWLWLWVAISLNAWAFFQTK